MTNRLPKLALLLALWPVWLWNFERLTDKSDEPLSLLALITLGYFLWERRSEADRHNHHSHFEPSIAALLTLAAYAISIPFAPKLIQGILAVAAMCLILPGSASFTLPLWMLALLSLPVMATLNFYLGFPLRVLVGSTAVPMLNMIGFSTSLEGTALIWNSQVVEIDAPCSGIKMLWFTTYFSAALSAFFNLKTFDVIKVFSVATIAAIAANVLRITSLFFLETGAIAIPEGWHDSLHQAVGVIVFLLAAVSTLLCASGLRHTKKSQIAVDSICASPQQSQHWRAVMMLTLCGIATVLPLCSMLVTHGPNAISSASKTSKEFPGWPTSFEGSKLQPLEQSAEQFETQQRFAAEFPGKIKVFTNGKQTILLRWVAQPTRQLHSSSDCYRGLGFAIKWLPMLIDQDGSRWSTFEANRKNEHLLIREKITDGSNASWSDVSSWYWAAVMQRTEAPWWATTVIVRQ